MKSVAVFIAVTTVALAAPAMAQDRDALETSMVTHAQAASAAATSAVNSINAGDTAGGCAAMRTAVDEISQAEALVAQDRPLIANDESLSDAERTAQQGQLSDLVTSFASSHSRLDVLIRDRC